MARLSGNFAFFFSSPSQPALCVRAAPRSSISSRMKGSAGAHPPVPCARCLRARCTTVPRACSPLLIAAVVCRCVCSVLVAVCSLVLLALCVATGQACSSTRDRTAATRARASEAAADALASIVSVCCCSVRCSSPRLRCCSSRAAASADSAGRSGVIHAVAPASVRAAVARSAAGRSLAASTGGRFARDARWSRRGRRSLRIGADR